MTRKKKIGKFVWGKIPTLSYRTFNGEKFYHHGWALTKKDAKVRVKAYKPLGCRGHSVKTKSPFSKRKHIWDIYGRCP